MDGQESSENHYPFIQLLIARPTQEVWKNTRLRLVFSPTLLSRSTAS